MLSLSLLTLPLLTLLIICSRYQYNDNTNLQYGLFIKRTSLAMSSLGLLISLIMFTLYDFSNNYFQFVYFDSSDIYYNLYFGLDGSSIYFLLLTAITIPIAILSNWVSISVNTKPFLVMVIILSLMLLSIFLVLDGFLFYVFFESILPPLFLLIGLFGSIDKVRASFYLFLYTLLGSLFMLLSLLAMSSSVGFLDFDAIYKTNFDYYAQLIFFIGILIAFAVKTPTIFLNTWLLKAHVESPLSGSIILAGVVLKLSLYGIFRLILPILSKAYITSTSFIYMIGVITIFIASISTIRTVDVKELIAYSSVCHAAVYFMSAFSNNIIGIEGSILLGLAHGFVSSGLFICVGGILYDRSGTRLINYYRGMAQLMPIFSILFFILCLANCGVPLTLNFLGEFMSLYGIFNRHIFFGVLASFSIIFSAAYTIYLFNRISFSGSYSKFFLVNIPDVNKRELFMLVTLVTLTILFGIYPSPLLNGMHYSISSLLYCSSLLYF